MEAARPRDHPHVVAVHGVVFDDDKPWMITRRVTGRPLLEHLARRGPLSAAEATRAARHPRCRRSGPRTGKRSSTAT
ncbi:MULTISPECIES: hypothetical protein [Streptomyces]|uniref:hypothetical protein n=1 Tax=Streptomyces TaxID=1883 RepID=UPI001E4A1A7D|nr:hypothetical protein [Streptomyces canarius]